MINSDLQAEQPGVISGYRVHFFEEVSSTNDVARKIAESSDKEQILILARRQYNGRGRRGNRWISLHGGLWFSIILQSRDPPSDAVKLMFIMATAVVETVRQLGIKATLKWPNDVLVGGKKICGIMSEGKVSQGIIERVTIGVGLNANNDPGSFPPHLLGSVTSLKHECGRSVDLWLFLENLLSNFEDRRRSLQSGHWQRLLQEWKNYASFLGTCVSVACSEGSIVGKAWDVDNDGSLLIKLKDGTTRRIMEGSLRLCETEV